MKLTQIKIIGIILVIVGSFIIGFFVGRGRKPNAETITVKEITVVMDTTEARMFADQADVLRKRINELENLKPQIKYVEIYKTLPNLTIPEVDSLYESAKRLDNN